ncbi:MAG: Holliday junction resolvase RuvX [Janthinobacterium lividum]
MELKPRILGLDIGDARVGIAMTDALGIAQPLITMARSSQKQELKNIARLIRKHGVAGLVAGNPLHMSGNLSPQALKAQAFAAAVRDEFQLPVYLQDERLSSTAAHELMDRLGYPRGESRKGVLDQYAAVVILQDWLDAQDRLADPPVHPTSQKL